MEKDPFDFVNGDRNSITVLNGWMNADTKKVIFCSRLNHLMYLEKGYLDGIAEDEVYDRGPAFSNDWTEIRRWAASKGWIHFVINGAVEKYAALEFVAMDTQVAVCEELAKFLQMRAEFK